MVSWLAAGLVNTPVAQHPLPGQEVLKSCLNMPKKIVSLCVLLSAGCLPACWTLVSMAMACSMGCPFKTSLHHSTNFLQQLFNPHPVLRCLGIPTRVITNYFSAHDNTGNLKTYIMLDDEGKVDRSRTRDSIWWDSLKKGYIQEVHNCVFQKIGT